MATDDVPCCEPMFWAYLIICVALVSFAGLMSGLTLGFMSLSLVDLEVIIKAGQPQDRKNAAKILPIVKNQHLLLCTLVIGNALAMEALPIFLDALLPALGAILISVTLILAFCEIVPHAVCSRYGLSVGAKLSIVVRLIIIVLFPVAYPISKLLDWFLGKKHSALFGRAELKILVDMHGKEAGKGGELSQHETTIITGALDMTQKTAKDAMTPLSKIFSLDVNSKLDEKTMGLIESAGHSRVPIYSGNPANIIGLILVKNLIKFRPDDETPMREITVRKIPRVHDHLPLYDILNHFQIGYSHMAVVVKCMNGIKELKEETKSECSMFKTNTNNQNSEQRKSEMNICIHSLSVYSSTDTEIETPIPSNVRNLRDCLHPNFKKSKCQDQNLSNEDLESLPAASDEEVIGIITLEDVIEELLQEEILDETDHVFVDVHNKIKLINMVASRRSPLIRSPIAASASHPVASPVSSYHQSPLSSSYNTPILHSPILPYVRSPLIRPTLSASPGKFVPNSPSKLVAGAVHCSPSSHRVSRKSYEKLRKPEDLQ